MLEFYKGMKDAVKNADPPVNVVGYGKPNLYQVIVQLLTDKIIQEIKKRCEEENLMVQVIGWKDAAFSYSGTVEGLGFIFNFE